ncbi:MAG: hypothetical protein AMXMBFR33_57820 [Candidatus Xenobia bacterium]
MPQKKGPNHIHVVPDPDGGWNAVRAHAERASRHFETQAETAEWARGALGRSGGGELLIHGENGQIRQRDTVPPGHDPRSIPG